MEGKRLVRSAFLTFICILGSCNGGISEEYKAEVHIDFKNNGFVSKAMDPHENAIHDASILVFDGNGMLEKSIWRSGSLASEEFTLNLVSGKKYRFLACVNFGYRVHEDNIENVLGHRFHMAYPDEYREGIPMTGDTGMIRIGQGSHISIELVRLMAKISLRIDRRKLSDNVEMKVRSVKIGNCPKSVIAFGRSRVEDPDGCFSMGFFRNADECWPLNQMAETGISKTLSVYMFENMQGRVSGSDINDDCDKVFGKDDPRGLICSYIELEADYLSPEWKSTGNGLIYRFYLGEDRNSLDTERNCHYRITVCPQDDGLEEDSWRVDKSNLAYAGPVSFRSWPDSYIRGNIGDKVHIGCSFTPAFASLDIGMEELMEDKANGIYDFEIDEDGHGVTLTLTGPGRGLVYMEVGEPVNEAAMWVIEVNLPDS